LGYHPLGAWLDNTNEALAALLRPGNAGSNTATDHLTVVEAALTQLPDRWRSKPILIRADGAGYSHALISALSQQGLEFSVGYPVTEAVREAIAVVPKWAWTTASIADARRREHADVVDVTKMLDLSRWNRPAPACASSSGYRQGSRTGAGQRRQQPGRTGGEHHDQLRRVHQQRRPVMHRSHHQRRTRRPTHRRRNRMQPTPRPTGGPPTAAPANEPCSHQGAHINLVSCASNPLDKW